MWKEYIPLRVGSGLLPVSEGLNSVERRDRYNHGVGFSRVSEGLNSVESVLHKPRRRRASGDAFQKD